MTDTALSHLAKYTTADDVNKPTWASNFVALSTFTFGLAELVMWSDQVLPVFVAVDYKREAGIARQRMAALQTVLPQRSQSAPG